MSPLTLASLLTVHARTRSRPLPRVSSGWRASFAFAGLLVAVNLALTASPTRADDAWKAAEGPLRTRWAADVSPERVWPEHPRPQLVREGWRSLNGLWQYAVVDRDASSVEAYDGEILVPFAIESALSGVLRGVGQDHALWYRRSFEVKRPVAGRRLYLRFEAVDWEARVFLNGKALGEHRGGYSPFSFDITDHLVDGEQELVVRVWDPTNRGYQPRGKQVEEPESIWYTSVTGIWQTVWLEEVPGAHVRSLRITPNVKDGAVNIEIDAAVAAGTVEFEVSVLVDGEARSRGVIRIESPEAPGAAGGKSGSARPHVTLAVDDARLWSPDDPYLYGLRVVVRQGDSRDEVSSYFGMRAISVETDVDGHRRMFLNGKPLFQLGPLDQGWWPDGLYTAPTDEALRYDIEVTRKLGFNMARKHVKVEPRRWYYHADRLGLLVWQDMPNGDRHIGPDDPDITRTPESRANYFRELGEMMDTLHNHPSIVVWVPFNEGWGQFETNDVLAWTKQRDPSRLVDGPSGWADRGEGDLNDMHRYPGPGMPQTESVRAVVLGEFGGLGLPVEGHLWWQKRNWGYRTYRTEEALRASYDALYDPLRELHARGLSAAVYTQTTDVEGEVNGLLTYDRAMIKVDPEHVRKLHEAFYRDPPVFHRTSVLPTSEKEGARWRYTTERPADGWEKPGFDASGWKEGPGGFGEPSTPGSKVRTEWTSADIWLRRTVKIEPREWKGPRLRIHHDEDVEVYIDGVLATRASGYTTEYTELSVLGPARASLGTGEFVIAVHCHQTRGGQYIDLGLVDVVEAPREAR